RNADIAEAANSVQALVFKMISVFDRSLLTGEGKVFIGDAIREPCKEAGLTENEDSLYEQQQPQGKDGKFQLQRKLKPMPVLSGLYEKMRDSNKNEVEKAAEMLKSFTRYGDRPSYSIFDGQSTVDIQSS